MPRLFARTNCLRFAPPSGVDGCICAKRQPWAVRTRPAVNRSPDTRITVTVTNRQATGGDNS